MHHEITNLVWTGEWSGKERFDQKIKEWLADKALQLASHPEFPRQDRLDLVRVILGLPCTEPKTLAEKFQEEMTNLSQKNVPLIPRLVAIATDHFNSTERRG